MVQNAMPPPPAYDPFQVQQQSFGSQSVPYPHVAQPAMMPMNQQHSEPFGGYAAPSGSYGQFDYSQPAPDMPFKEHPKPSMKSMSNKFRQSTCMSMDSERESEMETVLC